MPDFFISRCSVRLLRVKSLLAVAVGAALALLVPSLQGEGDTEMLSPPPATSATAADPWRRTRQGWQLTSRWPQPSPPTALMPAATAVHPAVVAVLQVLFSLGALLAVEPAHRPTAWPHPRKRPSQS